MEFIKKYWHAFKIISKIHFSVLPSEIIRAFERLAHCNDCSRISAPNNLHKVIFISLSSVLSDYLATQKDEKFKIISTETIKKQCDICGCLIGAKIFDSQNSCPLNKWNQ